MTTSACDVEQLKAIYLSRIRKRLELLRFTFHNLHSMSMAFHQFVKLTMADHFCTYPSFGPTLHFAEIFNNLSLYSTFSTKSIKVLIYSIFKTNKKKHVKAINVLLILIGRSHENVLFNRVHF